MDPVEDFLYQIHPLSLQKVAWEIHQLITGSIPQVKASIKWKIPFYEYKGALCYINPQKQQITLGIAKGASLTNTQGILEGKGKLVRHIYLDKPLTQQKQEAIVEVLLEGILWNEQQAKKTTKKHFWS